MEAHPKSEVLFESDGIVFYNDMTFESLEDNHLLMLHTVLHQKYANNHKDVPNLTNFHKSVAMEMNKRGLTHKRVDKMDDMVDMNECNK